MTPRHSRKVMLVQGAAPERAAMAAVLASAGYKSIEMDSAETALRGIRHRGVDIVITGLRLSGMDGIEFLKLIKAGFPDTEVILITAHASVDLAVQALKAGAFDFMTKPVKKAQLLHIVQKAAERQQLAQERRGVQSQAGFDKRLIVHSSPQMSRIMQMVADVAPSAATVLITGESGTGKDVIAEAIHSASRRAGKLIKVSCAALPDTLLESELFGYEKGAFTGASATKQGRFELADGGTLFLDEVAEISPAMQVKLLRVLQDGKFERLGGTRTIDSDVRIIAATNTDLRHEIAERRFRQDLFFRLNVVDIYVPALRERRDDIVPLATYFLNIYAERNHKEIEGFSEKAMQALLTYSWPGNVRELENAVERAVIFTNGRLVPLSTLPHLMPAFRESSHSLTFKIGMPWRELEHQAIENALAHARGNKPVAARLLGVAIRTIYRHLDVAHRFAKAA